MNKKYIDFVPTKKTSKVAAAHPGTVATKKSPTAASAGRVATKTTLQAETRQVVRKSPQVARKEVAKEGAAAKQASAFSIKNEPEYGVIEDYRPKFVHTEVEKRPLSRGHFAASGNELREAKAQNLSKKSIKKPVEKSASTKAESSTNAKMKVPKSPFISHSKVAKRPLSKNVYAKNIEPTKENAAGPVTIIDKSDKESKASIVVTILITIILGAVAGTIAFLILPK